MTDDEMLIKYARMIQNYCKSIDGGKCSTCKFNAYTTYNSYGSCCQFYALTRDTNFRMSLDETDTNDEKMMKKFFNALNENCDKYPRCDGCVFNEKFERCPLCREVPSLYGL